MGKEKFIEVLRFFNEAQSADDLAKQLQLPGTSADGARKLAASIFARRVDAGGMFTSYAQIASIAELTPDALTAIADIAARAGAALPPVEKERSQFLSLLLKNPNYFGNLEGTVLKPVKTILGNTTYEEITCVGLNPPHDRLEAVLQVKKDTGYSGGMCAGSVEYVRFYVDLHDNGVYHDVGIGHVTVHDIPGHKPLCYAVYKDFSSIRKLCFNENIVKVRAILSWNVPPPPDTPNFNPVWGNRMDVEVQIRPSFVISLGDLIGDLKLSQIPIPDPAGLVIKVLDPETLLPAAAAQPLSVAQKKALYKTSVPVHRFAFPEAMKLLSAPAGSPDIFAKAASPLQSLGLAAKEIDSLIDKLAVVTDGDTSFEQLHCAGLRSNNDTLEAVLTVKKSTGFSGSLCSTGSTEYVAFWIDFSDGSGFHYLGTATVPVFDLAKLPAKGAEYGVFHKANLTKWRIPCEFGARIGRLRAILSWETPPPPNNPNYVPVWGNRVECNVQIKPGTGTGHTPLIETVGDAPVPIINPGDGLATGNLNIASAVFVNQSPFGGEVTITGEVLNPPSVLAGGALPFKYRIEVSVSGANDFHPLTNSISLFQREAINGFPVFCGFFQVICPVTLTPSDDGDGFGDGWYTYLEDPTPAHSRHIVTDILARWQTTPAMEGLWDIRLSAKDPNTNTLYSGIQTVTVRIDNTPPTAELAITGATFNGNPVAAADCGKFQVGTILSGTYSSHDPGTVSPALPFQHFGSLSFQVLPVIPAHGAAVNPSSRSFPTVNTDGENGTWTLDTHGMDACGYVIHMVACDRTNFNSTGNAFCVSTDVGFCLE